SAGLLESAAEGGALMRSAAMSLALLVVVASVSVPSSSAQSPPALVVQVAAEPPGLDLTATPASATAGVVFYNIQESLVKVDRHGKLVGWLPPKRDTQDNTKHTFFLKKGVRFHNGREMKAADVKFVFDRAMN